MKKIITRLKDWITVLTTPTCWIQVKSYEAGWDQELNRLLDRGHHFTDITRYEAKLGPFTMWITNHPYASFSVGDARPRRATILRAHRYLMTDKWGTPR